MIELTDGQYTAVLVLLLGLVFIIIGIYFSNRRKRLLAIGMHTDGIIMEVVREPSGRSGSIYHPVVRFTTTRSEWITKKYNAGREYGYYKEAADVKVIYDPNNPEDFLLDDWSSKTDLGLIIMIVGVLMSIASLAFIMSK